jgi:hypothetical protein
MSGILQLSVDELELAYPGRKVSPEHMCNLVALFDLFCLSEVQWISMAHLTITNKSV